MTATLTQQLPDPGADLVSDVVSAAERLLTRRTGAEVTLVDPVDLGGSGNSLVLRVRVAANPFSLPRTLVIKQQPSEGAPTDELEESFRREAACYQFANSLATETRPGPELLAHDLSSRLLVITDLGDAPAMGELLARKDPAEVSHSLMAVAQALGRMHAATFGREEDFVALQRRSGGGADADPVARLVDRAVDELPGMLSQILGVEVPTAMCNAVDDARRLFGTGGYRAFSPADLCPDNILVNGDGVRFLDYEWGGFRDATLDIAYALASFPSCLCALALEQDQVEDMIEAWRAEVVGIWPQLGDDATLYSRILEAQLIWVWMSTHMYLPDDDHRIAAARGHELAAPRTDALRLRWAALAAFARRQGAQDIAAHADQVHDALNAGR